MVKTRSALTKAEVMSEARKKKAQKAKRKAKQQQLSDDEKEAQRIQARSRKSEHRKSMSEEQTAQEKIEDAQRKHTSTSMVATKERSHSASTTLSSLLTLPISNNTQFHMSFSMFHTNLLYSVNSPNPANTIYFYHVGGAHPPGAYKSSHKRTYVSTLSFLCAS